MDNFDLKQYLTENKLTENENSRISAQELLHLVKRDLQDGGYWDPEDMFTYDEAVKIMNMVVQVEGADVSGKQALDDYLASGELNKIA
jgi:hypothetical protein